jgi:hypothetical protein
VRTGSARRSSEARTLTPVASVDHHEAQRGLSEGHPGGQACLAGAGHKHFDVSGQLAVDRGDLFGLVAWMMALCMPSAVWWVKRTVGLVKSAEERASRYSCRDRAPAMRLRRSLVRPVPPH